MNIFEFIKKLLPRVDRAAVIEDLRITEKELANIVTPSWQAAADYFKLNKPVSPEHQQLHQQFFFTYRMTGTKPTSFVTMIAKLLVNLQSNVQFLESVIEENLQKDILPEGTTARGAFIVRAAGNFSVMTRYLLSLLNYVYTMEAKAKGQDLDPNLQLAKADVKYVEQMYTRFVRLFEMYTSDPDDFRKRFEEIPAIIMTKDAWTMLKDLFTSNKSILNEAPGKAGFVSPIYVLRLPIARWQNARYESSKNKKQQLELRLLYLQMQRDKAEDPSVIREIEQLQTRIDNLEKYLREVEEDVGV